jgi:hypothetical protein
VWFLKDQERILAMKYDFISQPLGIAFSFPLLLTLYFLKRKTLIAPAVAASMFSRCGMTWFLYTCFSSADKHIRIIILVGMVVQIVANSVTILQIVLQCGPNPYRLVWSAFSLPFVFSYLLTPSLTPPQFPGNRLIEPHISITCGTARQAMAQ